MEDPIKFDVWAKINPQQREVALNLIKLQKIYISAIELRATAMKSIKDDLPILVAKSLTFSSARLFITESQQFLYEQALYQEGCSNSSAVKYCSKHALYFGGCLGCHICINFYMA